MPFQTPYTDTEQARKKIKQFCAYQERCHAEVKKKLYALGVYKADCDLLLSRLIEENYLNEERYATAYAGGKFRIKHWGKIKIRYELRMKGISEYCINKAFADIDDKLYENKLAQLAQAKWKLLSGEKDPFIKEAKLYAYLSGKGYEGELIKKIIRIIPA